MITTEQFLEFVDRFGLIGALVVVAVFYSIYATNKQSKQTVALLKDTIKSQGSQLVLYHETYKTSVESIKQLINKILNKLTTTEKMIHSQDKVMERICDDYKHIRESLGKINEKLSELAGRMAIVLGACNNDNH